MSRRGFTLIEVVVALLILQVGLLGATGMVLLAQRSLAEAEALERGVAAVEGVLDSLGVGATPGGGARQLEVGVLRWSVAADGATTVRIESSGRLATVEVRAVVPVRGEPPS